MRDKQTTIVKLEKHMIRRVVGTDLIQKIKKFSKTVNIVCSIRYIVIQSGLKDLSHVFFTLWTYFKNQSKW